MLRKIFAVFLALCTLAGCASQPAPPDEISFSTENMELVTKANNDWWAIQEQMCRAVILLGNDWQFTADKVDFSYNYMENRQVIVVKKDSGIATVEDLKGKTAAVENGSVGADYAATFEDVTIKGCTKQTDCLMEVNALTADFAVLDRNIFEVPSDEIKDVKCVRTVVGGNTVFQR